MNNKNQCCSSGTCSCGSEQEKKTIKIDFLYLDLNECGRCQGTESKLHEAINEVSEVLKAADFQIIVNKVHINSKELAIKYQFVSSPTIRINGRDIALELKESDCEDCGDLCGDSVDCRVWIQDGVEYDEPPKAMIINAILKEIYGRDSSVQPRNEKYEIPANLNRFLEGIERKAD